MRLVTIGLALLGMGLALIVFTVAGLIRGAAIDAQAVVPGSLSIQAKDTGRYFLWDNHRTSFSGKRFKYPADCPDDVAINIKNADGKSLTFVLDKSQGWGIGNNEKTSIGYVDVDNPTSLDIEVSNSGRERIISVSNATLQEELWRRLGGIAVGIILGLLGLPIIFVGSLIRRRQSQISVE